MKKKPYEMDANKTHSTVLTPPSVYIESASPAYPPALARPKSKKKIRRKKSPRQQPEQVQRRRRPVDQRQYFNTFSLYQTWDGNKVEERSPKMKAPPVLPKKERVVAPPPSVKPFLLFLVVVVLATFFQAE